MTARSFAPAALAAAAAALLLSCGDDGYAPALRLDLADLISDGSGLACEMALDSGDTLRLSRPAEGFADDTVCRCLTVFRLVPEAGPGVAEVTSASPIIAVQPMRYDTVHTDPVGVTSVWTGGKYLNLRLLLRTKGNPHALGFAFLGYAASGGGAQTLNLALYNDSGGDMEYFSRETFVSCSLHEAMKSLVSGRDSVAVSINEYGKGFVTYSFPLP